MKLYVVRLSVCEVCLVYVMFSIDYVPFCLFLSNDDFASANVSITLFKSVCQNIKFVSI